MCYFLKEMLCAFLGLPSFASIWDDIIWHSVCTADRWDLLKASIVSDLSERAKIGIMFSLFLCLPHMVCPVLTCVPPASHVYSVSKRRSFATLYNPTSKLTGIWEFVECKDQSWGMPWVTGLAIFSGVCWLVVLASQLCWLGGHRAYVAK